MTMRNHVIVIGPVPPPFHGVTISTSLVLANPRLRERFEVEHLDTSDRRTIHNIGRWDVTNVVLGLRHLASLWRMLGGRRGVVYLPLSQGTPAYLRDSLFILAARVRRWKVAVHLRGGEFDSFYAGRSSAMRAWIRTTLRRVDSVGVMGESLRPMFDGLVPQARVAVVPNGTPDLSPNGAAPPATNGARGEVTVLYLGNLLARKGVVEAVDAALRVLEQRPEASFVFAGETPNDDVVRRTKERAASVGSIRFQPPVTGEDKRSLLLGADIVLFPPRLPEGHPRVVLESMAAGKPIVTTDRGAIAETVVDGETGFVLPDPVPSELADRLLRLLEDEALRERMGRAARERYLERYTQTHADERLAAWLGALAP